MTRRNYRYSLQRRDAKLAGVCATLGDKLRIDPTFIRIGIIAAFLFISWKMTLIAYAGLGIWLAVDRNRNAGHARASEFERMGSSDGPRPSVHALRTELDENGRRRMAVDHHLARQNDELAREIEALREDK